MGALLVILVLGFPVGYWFLFHGKTMNRAVWQRSRYKAEQEAQAPYAIASRLPAAKLMGIVEAYVPVDKFIKPGVTSPTSMQFSIGLIKSMSSCTFTVTVTDQGDERIVRLAVDRYMTRDKVMAAGPKMNLVRRALSDAIREQDPSARVLAS